MEDFINRSPAFKMEGSGIITPRDPDSIIQGDVLNNLNSFDLGERILSLMSSPILLNIMCEDPSGGTLSDLSGNGHDGTYSGTWAASQREKRGRCWDLNYNGTDGYIDFGDHNDFSFGDGSNDSPFTLFAYVDVVLSAGWQTIIGKYDTAGGQLREYVLWLTNNEMLELTLGDESAGVTCDRASNAAITAGKHTIVTTYDGAGGATAANTIKFYVDGVLIASTATNSGTYVAMENLSCSLYAGAFKSTGAVSLWDGSIGCIGIDASEWSALNAWKFHQLCLAAYSEDGINL